MRTKGSAAELERRRRLAVDRVREGHAQTEVAHFLGVHVRTVQRWVEAYRKNGDAGLDARPHPGPKPRLLPEFVPLIRDWLRQPPHKFYRGQYLWTAKLLARRIKYQ